MKWTSSVSTSSDSFNAVSEVVASTKNSLQELSPDLLLLFLTPHHLPVFPKIALTLQREFPSIPVVGCSAGGVLAGGIEVEQRPGLSLTAAALPGIAVAPFHLAPSNLLNRCREPTPWLEHFHFPLDADPHFLLIPDPFSCDVNDLLYSFHCAFPKSRCVGALASGGRFQHQNALIFNGEVRQEGTIGVALAGPLEVDTVVCQGCRPIGTPMFVTRCHENELFELDMKPPLEVLQELYSSLEPRDQQLFRNSLFIGIEMRGDKVEYLHGDFLIRNIQDADPRKGSITVGTPLERFQIVQFHLRDARTASEDLDRLLLRYRASHANSPEGALLFSCLGRGQHLFGEPHHDSQTFRRFFPHTSLGGFFGNGEIGPVGGTAFVHGYTSAFALFRPAVNALSILPEDA